MTPLTVGIFQALLDQMKQLLRMGEFKFGPNSNEYRYYKEETMKYSYQAAGRLFGELMRAGSVEKCPCGASGQGWTDCADCGGSGYKTTSPRVPGE